MVLAVALMAGISLAHAFEQGNKRTAFEAMWHFLRLNGYDLAIEDTETWADAVISLIEHRSTEEDFAQALSPSWCRGRKPPIWRPPYFSGFSECR